MWGDWKFSDAQLHVLRGICDVSNVDPNVRKWTLKTRRKFFASNSLMVTLRLAYSRGNITIAKDVCIVDKCAFVAVSPVFAKHHVEKALMSHFTFHVGNMDSELRVEHEKAIEALGQWLHNLASPTVTELTAPTFYSELSLRHIARQLGMQLYLPTGTDAFVQQAMRHVLQPWQIIECLYILSADPIAPIPMGVGNDPLFHHITSHLQAIASSPSVQPSEKDALYCWLGEEENKVLQDAMWPEQTMRKKKRKSGDLEAEKEKETLELVDMLIKKIKVPDA